MIRLTKLHEEGRQFVVRMCMNIEMTDDPVESSVVRECEECDAKVWYDTAQKIPEMPGMVIEGEVVLCLVCTLLHESIDGEPAQWVGPNPFDNQS